MVQRIKGLYNKTVKENKCLYVNYQYLKLKSAGEFFILKYFALWVFVLLLTFTNLFDSCLVRLPGDGGRGKSRQVSVAL